MSEGTERTATALVTYEGRPVATVGPFPVATPHWADVAPVAAHLERELGVPVAVLRLVDASHGGASRGGHVTYHAEALTDPGTRAGYDVAGLLRPAAHRMSWATADGVRDVLRWADRALRDAGRPATGRPEQTRSWNLSGMFRIPTAAGPVWLKETAPFATDESATIALLASVAPDLVPTVVAADPARHRVILDDLPGQDCWHAPADVLVTAVRSLATAQAALADRARDTGLTAIPAGGLGGLGTRVHGLLDGRPGRQLDQETMVAARKLADAVPGMVAELAACGLPETVVHGDFNPGNHRWDGTRVTLVDFADSGIGNPVLDGLRPGMYLRDERVAAARDAWVATWREHRPGSDPARALRIAEPLAHLCYAVTYQVFLDNIETSERRYHETDPADEIRAALSGKA